MRNLEIDTANSGHFSGGNAAQRIIGRLGIPFTGNLDTEQAFALKKMENSNENYFITGKAGTGKSFLLDAFKNSTRKKNLVLAPTGIAALHVDGATLHRTFGYRNLVHLGLSSISQETIQLSSEKRQLLKEVQTIIIDEISMVRADTFDKIDRILKVINHNNQPFGGKQMHCSLRLRRKKAGCGWHPSLEIHDKIYENSRKISSCRELMTSKILQFGHISGII